MQAVTLGGLIRAEKHLEIGCHVCGLHVFVDPADIALPDDTPVPSVCDALKCPQCGTTNAETGYVNVADGGQAVVGKTVVTRKGGADEK